MRVGDSSAITSSVKSWLFQDMLEKPQEMVTYRQVELGGLSVHCVRTRAMAMLIHTFLAQAICPRFNNNQYLNQLYKWHVLEDRDIPSQASLHTTLQPSSSSSRMLRKILL